MRTIKNVFTFLFGALFGAMSLALVCLAESWFATKEMKNDLSKMPPPDPATRVH